MKDYKDLNGFFKEMYADTLKDIISEGVKIVNKITVKEEPMKFKIGDRVKAKSGYGIVKGGQIGTINVLPERKNGPYWVKFDDHDNLDEIIFPKGLDMFESYLELITEEPIKKLEKTGSSKDNGWGFD